MAQAVRRMFGRDGELPIVRRFSADTLSTALGQGNVVHGALLAGSVGKAVLKQVARLEAYRQPDARDSDSDRATRPAADAS